MALGNRLVGLRFLLACDLMQVSLTPDFFKFHLCLQYLADSLDKRLNEADKMWSTGEGNANHFSILALRTP